MEKRTRSLAKTISWRVLATSMTIFLVFAFTGNLAISSSIGVLEMLSKSFIYYIHERIWNLVHLGRGTS